MRQNQFKAVILAAGKGTRLKSDLPKVLHPLFGKPLLVRVLDTLGLLSAEEACVIVGHGRDQVSETLDAYEAGYAVGTVVQEPQLGTGHALLQVRQKRADWQTFDGDVLILSGDVPLLEASTLQTMLQAHQAEKNDLTVLVATMDNPFGYGRVLIEGQSVVRVVEQKDATDTEKQVKTVNTGIYCLNWAKVSPLLEQLSSNNAQGEFYLTDVIALAVQAGYRVGLSHLDDPDEVLGVNARADLAQCHDVLNQRTLNRLMADGVTILHPASTFIGPEVKIGADSTVLPGCYLQGDISIGKRCTIGPHTTMSGSVEIADDVKVMQSAVRDSRIGAFSNIGPFAQLRDGVDISHHVNIGNFVEVKKTRIDHHTNAAHLTYLGDAELGADVNIGAGTITANYDPVRDIKERTVIADGAKIGSNSVLIAPVTVGENASVAAGSVITKNVKPWDLAIARGRQVDITGWVKRAKASTVEVKP
ncbi:bifunctional UDP-N-acetylglucosamine diphosphorylase/glucosamine-1-phosphate N-acetyltransferase GlmU [Vampirovibrio sp.]|uniref:bifunctional UDP-N-acetylglucosamine diphosphorylase/glucosamine-1-phosphate N-acetyltransferase GlmU n=1 Tax=Vampirovibrio sp. TaxID=2717857 RepID=UPI0035948C28